MNTLTRIFVLLLTGSVLLVGCDSLDLQPKTELASDQVWQDEALTRAYLNDIYSETGYGFGDPMLAGLADEAVNTHGHGDGPTRLSILSPSDRGLWDWGADAEEFLEKFEWENIYGAVRDLNTLLINVRASEALPEEFKQTVLGEAHFLRAFFYHNLLRQYGGVPTIAGTFDLSGDLEQYQIERNTFAETVDFVTADLDSAASRLSPTARRPGAASQGAAMALKCRVLVHAASDLYSSEESPFSGNALVAYQSGSQQERWQAAKEACQAVMDLGEYSLEQTETPQAYHELFTKGNESGTIWARYFNESGGEAHNQSQWVSPNGYNSWSGDAPTQQHVNAYEMADGSEFEWQGANPATADEPVDAENPYDNRDPRLYANILYNGALWRPRPEGLQELDPRGIIQTGWYEVPGQNTLRPGLDTREGPVQTWNGTRTGYNLAKFVDRDIEPSQEQAYNPWPFLRYAEVLLNYAEASAELGDTQDALMALNQVRSRVGMPPVPADGGPERTLMERIRQEREVELAFEEFRFFDVRRWMIAPEVYDGWLHGIRIEGQLDPDGELLVDHRYDYLYQVTDVLELGWNDKAYFLPIPLDEMNRNPNLAQNPGYN